MITLTQKCILKGEPVLLVGDTGCGKTTVCQILSGSNIFIFRLTLLCELSLKF
jgi:midasin (ATPase involved in ribosome maturation)